MPFHHFRLEQYQRLLTVYGRYWSKRWSQRWSQRWSKCWLQRWLQRWSKCWLQRWSQPLQRSSLMPTASGFTLIEVLTVIAIVGILASIVAPSWLALSTRMQVATAQDEIWQAIRQTQRQATASQQIWITHFQQAGDRVEWVSHPATSVIGQWQALGSGVHLDTQETTLAQRLGVYQLEFDGSGHTPPPLGRITLASNRNPTIQRCVIVSTVLGNLRKGTRQSSPDSGGRFCY